MSTSKYSEYAAMIKASIIEENRRKVQRRKEESKFSQSISQNFQLSHLETIRSEMIEEKNNAKPVEVSPPRTQTSSEPREEPIRNVYSFSASIRCLEPTHGGTSLWTGEHDGSIGIRNGVTGEYAYRIAPSHDDAGNVIFVDSLFGSGNNMFVGLSDGTVRVYDRLVFVLAFEAKCHSSSVTSFTITFDQRTFSASTDGSLVKWDTESKNFERLGRAEQDQPLQCLTAYGYSVFTGTLGGDIITFDTDTLDVTKTFRRHTAGVNCIVIQDGYLFSGSSDHAVIVWCISTGDVLQVLEGHQSPVTGMFGDAVGNQIWSVDSSGVMNVWSSCDDKDFGFVRSCAFEGNTEVFGLRGIIVLDAMKVWSLGSNGINKVWHSSVNRVEEGIRGAIRTMQGVIEQDEVELVKWDQLTQTLHTLSKRMDGDMAHAMESLSHNTCRLKYFFEWMRWLWTKRHQRIRRVVATCLEKRAIQTSCQRAFACWHNFLRMRARQKQQEAVAVLMRRQHDERLKVAYAKKLQDHAASLLKRSRAERMTSILMTKTNTRKMLSAFRLLATNRIQRQVQRKLTEVARSCEGLSCRLVAHRAFCDWLSFASRRRRRVLREGWMMSCSERMRSACLRSCYHRWLLAVAERRRQTIRKRNYRVLDTRVRNSVVTRYFRSWLGFSMIQKQSSLRREQNELELRSETLDFQISSIEHLLQRRKLLEEADQAIAAAQAKTLSKRESINALELEIAELRAALERKKHQPVIDVEKTIQEQLADLISVLKCKLINFYSDFPQLQRVADKARRLGPQKIFLEAHQVVKRMVVEMTGEGYLANDVEWPLTDKMIRSMKAHHSEMVLGAIKTMIVAYDALNAAQRASLVSDREIIVNAHNLHLLADQCVALRNKRNHRR